MRYAVTNGAPARATLYTWTRTSSSACSRFGWTAPWATVVGWRGETYGDVLITIKLAPEALIVRVRASTDAMEVVDLEGRIVSLEAVLARPDRIAAVYFVQDLPQRGGGTWAGTAARAAFREYVICNESNRGMVDRHGA